MKYVEDKEDIVFGGFIVFFGFKFVGCECKYVG